MILYVRTTDWERGMRSRFSITEPDAVHPLSDPRRFYLNTESLKPSVRQKSGCADSFILISAGYDGLYGTADDICNFQWKYRE